MKASLLLLAACATEVKSPGTLRFKDQPAAQLVDDRRDTPKKPSTRVFERASYFTDIFAGKRWPDGLRPEAQRYAGDVNALDEVPDSTWFTNRIGVRDVSLDEIRTAGRGKYPAPKGPWVVTGTKVGGASVGLLVKDANGHKFIMKFDNPGEPEMQTAADVVVQKLLWAAGYYVPDDAIVEVSKEELKLDGKAKIENVFGDKKPMRQFDLDKVLGEVDKLPNGHIRTLVSRFLDGEPVGGWAREGIRRDDPNDVVPHQDRRTARALLPIFAWLDNTDVKEDNGLDMYVEDGGRHYLLHYVLDFGLALGVYGYDQIEPADGYAYSLDLGADFKALFSLGLWRRPWEGADGPKIKGVGRFESAHYSPLIWRDHYPFSPFFKLDAGDAFWAAKLILKFTEPQIRAAVEEGKYSDPKAVDYIVQTLIERQRQTAYDYFRGMTPLDEFKLEGEMLCFADLLPAYFEDTPTTKYVATSYDGGGKRLGSVTVPMAGERTCVGVPMSAYTIVELSAMRGDATMPPIRVHLAKSGSEAPRVIGIRRAHF